MKMQGQPGRQMPQYKCHKEVWALKIAKIEYRIACCEACVVNGQSIVCGRPESEHTPEAAKGDVGMDHDFIPGTWNVPGALITPADEDYAAFEVGEEYTDKHNPQAGGYFVVYKDGYQSFSPALAFEEGYTLIR